MTNPHTTTIRLIVNATDNADLLRLTLLELQRRGLVRGIGKVYNGGHVTPVAALTVDPLEVEEESC